MQGGCPGLQDAISNWKLFSTAYFLVSALAGMGKEKEMLLLPWNCFGYYCGRFWYMWFRPVEQCSGLQKWKAEQAYVIAMNTHRLVHEGSRRHSPALSREHFSFLSSGRAACRHIPHQHRKASPQTACDSRESPAALSGGGVHLRQLSLGSGSDLCRLRVALWPPGQGGWEASQSPTVLGPQLPYGPKMAVPGAWSSSRDPPPLPPSLCPAFLPLPFRAHILRAQEHLVPSQKGKTWHTRPVPGPHSFPSVLCQSHTFELTFSAHNSLLS